MKNNEKFYAMAEMPTEEAVSLFLKLNIGKVSYNSLVIITNYEPRNLNFPLGWYYAKGEFRNKHNTRNGRYDTVLMLRGDGTPWEEVAKYSTKDL